MGGYTDITQTSLIISIVIILTATFIGARHQLEYGLYGNFDDFITTFILGMILFVINTFWDGFSEHWTIYIIVPVLIVFIVAMFMAALEQTKNFFEALILFTGRVLLAYLLTVIILFLLLGASKKGKK